MSEVVGPEPAAAPPAAAGPVRSLKGQDAFAPVGPNARITATWAVPFAQLVIYIVSLAPTILITAAVVIPLILTSGAAVGADGALPPDLELPILVTAVVVQFPAWAILVILWARGYERRSLASLGFRGPQPLKKYGIGFGLGVLLAVALTLLSPLAAPETALDMTEFDISRVFGWDWLLMMIAVLAVFMMQGASEEVACRGWMLSAVSARRGIVAGVLVNTGVFAALHAHFYRDDSIEIVMLMVCALTVVTLTGWLRRPGLIAGLVISALVLAVTPWSLTPEDLVFGTTAVVAVGCVGLFLSLWAVWERSIVGVCGIHGAFNASLVIMGMVAIAATTPDATPSGVLLQTFREATGQSGEISFGGVALQFAVFASLSGLAWRWIAARRPDFR